MGVDLKKVLTYADSRLKGRTVGYGIAIYQDGELKRSTSGGWAVLGTKKFESLVRSDLGSMGKTLTAAATVAALLKAGKTVDEPISKYLPKGWSAGPNVSKLTFRMLLTHTGGLVNTKVDSNAELRALLAKGVPAKVPTGWDYENCNYGLLRVLLPYVALGRASLDALSWMPVFPSMLGTMYVECVRKLVLAPAGVGDADIVYAGPAPKTRYYDVTNTKDWTEGMAREDAVALCGAGFWTLSVREYGRVIEGLRRGEVAPGTWKVMRDSAGQGPNTGFVRLGMYHEQGKHGDYFGHNGGWADGRGAGAFSDWTTFPGGITVVIAANSAGGTIEPPQDIVRAAYEGAVTTKPLVSVPDLPIDLPKLPIKL